MVRVAKSPRSVKIFRLRLDAPLENRREQVAEVMALNLPEAIATWYDSMKEEGYHAPLFKANTVTLLTADDEEELYVATD